MKYKVLKECVLGGRYRKVGDEYCITGNGDDVAPDYIAECLEYGFLEPITEDPKIELSGQYVPEEGGAAWCIKYDTACERVVLLGEIDSIKIKEWAALGMSFYRRRQGDEWTAKIKAYQILRRDTKGFKPDWERGDQVKWTAIYHHYYSKLTPIKMFMAQRLGEIYFESREDAEESIKEHKAEWLTVLGVEK